MENLVMLSIEDFNTLYNGKGLRIELLTSISQWEDFNRNFSYGLDYRVSTENNSISISSLSPISLNKSFITSEVVLLYENDIPAGVATLIVEPKQILTTYKGLFLDKNIAKVISLDAAIGVLPDFSIVRGWRVLNPNLRGLGIGSSLRKVISSRIQLLLEQYPQSYNLMFLGMVASSLSSSERSILQTVVEETSIGSVIDLSNFPISIASLGNPSEVSINVYKDYLKDGFFLVPNCVFPKSFGPLFYKKHNY